jgi:acid phosphatase class B
MIYLVDIDGTVADCSHRLHFIQTKPANWDAFFAACPNDTPIKEVIDVVRMLANAGARLVFVTGRSNAVELETQDWLVAHKLPWLAIYMRKAGDHREDNVVKGELLDEIISDWNNEPIGGVFEDRQQVVDMYRKRGLHVFQVAPGNF